jgi:probable DNA repair protein
MGSSFAEIDAGLRAGERVVTASDRAARSVLSAFHRARRAEGLTAWVAPNVMSWQSFARSAWDERSADGRLVLNFAQEQVLWADIVERGDQPAATLEGPRHRLASMAMEAHELLCSYAPRLLEAKARSGWQQDAAAFSKWLAAFDEICAREHLLSANRLALDLISHLEQDRTKRAPLLLAGFDRLLPVQSKLLAAWGDWREVEKGELATQVSSFFAPDAQSELEACAEDCRMHLSAAPDARLLVITQDAAKRRGEIERAFLKHADRSGSPRFEFSLGIPVGQVALARGARWMLRWLSGALEETDLDWLLSTGQAATSADEAAALQAYMRTLRRHGLQRTQWTLRAFTAQMPARLPVAWLQRMISAQRLIEAAPSRQSPLEWAGLVPRVLEAAGWPGFQTLASAEFQAAQRWQLAVDTCGSLGFDGRRIAWKDFLGELNRIVDETLFAAESEDAPIMIAGPAESAGLTADAIWFLGADEDAWPARGAMHPLLPLEVQREAHMPHATPQLDWDLANSITNRLLHSAPKVRFSYARQNDGVDARPSRLVTPLAGEAQPLPASLLLKSTLGPKTICYADTSRVALHGDANASAVNYAGGSTVLSSQSQCAFKAFATARLAARDWDAAEAGLTPPVRGQLLHAVLHAVWGGPPDGVRSQDELRALPDRRAFVTGHVQRELAAHLPPSAREQMPRRYLELEERRLTRLVTEWLEFELTRQPFTVAGTEIDTTATVAGLTLRLRLDRIDRLNDESLLVVDYKTGEVSPKSWDLPRPEDVQLPLYAGFAEKPDGVVSGLVFARVRPGDRCFAGRVGDARGTLLNSLTGNSALVRDPLQAEDVIEWKEAIEQLARDFLAGRAEVNPREYPTTCERCGLQTLCRIQEHRDALAAEDELENAEPSNE